tara:strand:- start:577 stop:954 length:378 start_codon:yes stop_codon:yes gene_type:complete
MIRYLLIVSVLLNSALLISVLGLIPFFLYLSILVIVALVWFIYNLLNKIEDMTEDQNELFVGFYEFSEHLQGVHELEMFYGEPVLTDLIDHSKKIVQDIEDYRELYLYDEDVDIDEIPEEQADAS